MTSPWETATMSGHLCHKCGKNFDVKMHGTADNGSPTAAKHARMCATWSVIEGLPCTCGAVPGAEQRDDPLREIRARDRESGALWFTGPASFTAQAARDRRALLAFIERWPLP